MKTTTPQTRIATFGELLLRMSVADGNRFTQANDIKIHVGGAEANVCVLLSQLGIQTDYITRLPQNDLAQLAVNELQKHKVNTSKCVYGGERLGLYFVESGNQIRQSQVIYDRSNSSFATIQKNQIDWNEVLKDVTHFHWSGISPGVSYEAGLVCKEGILAAHEKGLPISSDFNYRSKLWQYGKKPSEIMPDLLQYSTITVADLDAIEIYFGIKTDKKESDEDRFQKTFELLKKEMPFLKTLAMSFRKSDGPAHLYKGLLLHEGNFYETKEHKIHVVTDQIGSGDAFNAGLLYGLSKKLSGQECIEWATACGVIKQSIHGDFAITSLAEISHFMENGSSNRINR
ncbi:sugar kinase [Flavobacterium sp. LHD-80]|uniref:sugar kinase n=1 Tax=Flavobacterium sp. LHD-80 TaxID=3071411 RepID=UPI0027E07E4C|nr:sugar kinase [Flavobacterium sp. LHD-80]MDQ6471384.1 sugar kinase [Flavobacterium sp. LHD-80]